MGEVAAELFDGKSTASQKVVLALSEKEITITGGDGAVYHFPFSRITSPEAASNSYRITCYHAEESPVAVTWQIVFTDAALYHELCHRKLTEKNLPARMFEKFWKLPVLHVSIGVVLLTALVLYLFMQALLSAYKLTPHAYDLHLEKRVDATFMRMYDRCTAPELDSFLTKAAVRLSLPADRFRHRVVVLNNPTENAVSIPGGTIYVYRGLIEKSSSPDEILGVLSHEIAHAEERHSVRQIIQSMGIYYLSTLVIGMTTDGFDLLEGLESALETSSLFLMLRYSRAFEREADSLAIIRLHHAQLKVGPLDSLLTRIAPPPRFRDKLFALVSTHPLQVERSKMFTAARERETFTDDTLFAKERAAWNRIKAGCTNSGKPKPIWKKIISK